MSQDTPGRDCANCGRTARLVARGWCGSCYARWHWAGKPASGIPPRIRDWEGHLDDLRFLLGAGVTRPRELAPRLGVSERQVYRYLTALRAQP